MRNYVDMADILQYVRKYNFRNLLESVDTVKRSVTTTPILHCAQQHKNDRKQSSDIENCIEISVIPLQKKTNIDVCPQSTHLNIKPYEDTSHLRNKQKTSLIQLIRDISPNQYIKREARRCFSKSSYTRMPTFKSKTNNTCKFDHLRLYVNNKNDGEIPIIRTKKPSIDLRQFKKEKSKFKCYSKGPCNTSIEDSFGIKSILPEVKDQSFPQKSALKYSKLDKSFNMVHKSRRLHCKITPILKGILGIEKKIMNKTSLDCNDTNLGRSKPCLNSTVIHKKLGFISVIIQPKQKQLE